MIRTIAPQSQNDNPLEIATERIRADTVKAKTRIVAFPAFSSKESLLLPMEGSLAEAVLLLRLLRISTEV